MLNNTAQRSKGMKPLLLPKRDAEHSLYARLRDSTDSYSAKRRDFFDALWLEYSALAPRGFAKKLQFEFHQRWWEMYLTIVLAHRGFNSKRNLADAGPDIELDVEGQQVFIEATAPKVGSTSDCVPEPVRKGTAVFPERECLLRLAQALTDKKSRLQKYVTEKIIPESACTIIALSASDLNQFGTLLDSVHPALLSILAGAGPTVVSIREETPPYSSRRSTLARDSGSTVNAALFDAPDFSIVSGVLYSPVDVWNAELEPGDSLSLFVNPLAQNKIPDAFQKCFLRWTQEITSEDAIEWKKTQREN